MTWLNSFIQSETFHKIILTLTILLLTAAAHVISGRAVRQTFKTDLQHSFRLSRLMNTLIEIVAALVILNIWFINSGYISVTIGMISAGLAFALQEVIGSFAGWLSIVTGKPFVIGDRIETGNIHGCVMDIGVLRTTLAETGKWMSGENNTGRVVTVSNASIFKEPLYNATKYHDYIWDDITVAIPINSDWQKAKQLILDAIQSDPLFPEHLSQMKDQQKSIPAALPLESTSPECSVYTQIVNNWIELSLVYPVPIEIRRTCNSRITERILTALDQANIKTSFENLPMYSPSHAAKP